MRQIESIREMQEWSAGQRLAGKRLALVPTMGYLHEGHLSLVDEARRRADLVAMSIFVNPTQFGPNEDFEKYPRDLPRDRALAESRGVDVLFVPAAAEMYPPGDQTAVTVAQLSRGLCGAFRPGHFRGVATVVAKLFLIAQPHVAVFGEKDYQQLKILQRMVRDLHMPVEVVGLPTLREKEGLAMSSRNAYLSEAERMEALNISRAIAAARDAAQSGERRTAALRERALAVLAEGKNTVVQYLEIVDAGTLEPAEVLDRPARLILAVYLNGKRLIDNGPL
ncbi:MAG: pantoate--beta-alanine ligase [Deltaproteobacteria bacterium]|nr:pantoate--beta-alanine ligase [Deltaproteobacteria bacterium]